MVFGPPRLIAEDSDTRSISVRYNIEAQNAAQAPSTCFFSDTTVMMMLKYSLWILLCLYFNVHSYSFVQATTSPTTAASHFEILLTPVTTVHPLDDHLVTWRHPPATPKQQAWQRAVLDLAAAPARDGHARIPLTNYLEFQFYGPVAIGHQVFQMVFDTGSADVWVPDATCTNCSGTNRFNRQVSPSFRALIHKGGNGNPNPMNISLAYGSGEASGSVGQDTISLATLNLREMRFGLMINESIGLQHMQADGLAGMAFGGLATISRPPLIEAVCAQFPHVEPIFSFRFSRVPNARGSVLLIGKRVFDPELNKPLVAPIVPQYMMPAGVTWTFWTVEMHSFRLYDTVEACEGGCVGIVDTGTSLLGIPNELYLGVMQAIGVYTQETSGCICTLTMYGFQCFLCRAESFPTLNVGLGKDLFFTLTGHDYVLCQSLVCIPLLQPAGQGLFIFGDVFLKKYPTVFDVAKKQIEFGCLHEDMHCGLIDDAAYQKKEEDRATSVISIATFMHQMMVEPSRPWNLQDEKTSIYLVLWTCTVSLLASFYLLTKFVQLRTLRHKRLLNLVYHLAAWLTCYYLLILTLVGLRVGLEVSEYGMVYLVNLAGYVVLGYATVMSIECIRASRGYTREDVDVTSRYHVSILLFASVLTAIGWQDRKVLFDPEYSSPIDFIFQPNASYSSEATTLDTLWLWVYILPVGILWTLSIVAWKSGQVRFIGSEEAQLTLTRYVWSILWSFTSGMILTTGTAILDLTWPAWVYQLNEIAFYSFGLCQACVWTSTRAFQAHDQYESQPLVYAS